MAADWAPLIRRALGAVVLITALVAGWPGSAPSTTSIPHAAEHVAAGPSAQDTTPQADARPGAPPYAIARKPAGNARSEHKRIQPSDDSAPRVVAALKHHLSPPPPVSQRPLLSARERPARPFPGYRFLSRAPPAASLC